MRIVGRLVAVLLGVALIAVLAVVAVDAWRAFGVTPEQCGSTLLEPQRGELRDDTSVQATAWSAVADRNSRVGGDLDGSRPVLNRTCLVYAGRLDDDAGPTVVFLETTSSRYTVLLRIAEVRLAAEGGDAQFGMAGYPVHIGSELSGGLVLPLSGRYLAPADVTGVLVMGASGGAGSPARSVGDAVFDTGITPDRSGAPDEQVPDVPATFVLDRADLTKATIVVVPVTASEIGPPVRAPLTLSVDDRRRADAATQPAVLAVLPLFYADPRVSALLGRAPGFPSLAVRTAPLSGGTGVVVASGGDSVAPGLPVFRYFVPVAGPVVAAPA